MLLKFEEGLRSLTCNAPRPCFNFDLFNSRKLKQASYRAILPLGQIAADTGKGEVLFPDEQDCLARWECLTFNAHTRLRKNDKPEYNRPLSM